MLLLHTTPMKPAKEAEFYIQVSLCKKKKFPNWMNQFVIQCTMTSHRVWATVHWKSHCHPSLEGWQVLDHFYHVHSWRHLKPLSKPTSLLSACSWRRRLSSRSWSSTSSQPSDGWLDVWKCNNDTITTYFRKSTLTHNIFNYKQKHLPITKLTTHTHTNAKAYAKW